ncbi:MAG: ATP-binding cassette domain-containing protein [Lentilactobacillus diolivorans]|nr:ATP-binding cassette domain-containing protein [Lentilactobacillus diolivorans]RRG04081.1 MAG: ATP-binding cassette domain-containing protein [Lactobacillus sp.]
MLKIQNLNLKIGQKQILRNMTISFESGDVYGIVGPNGVGKTTLFKSILSITRYQGKINIDGKPINDAQVGKLIEYPNFYQALAVKQNLQLSAKYIGTDEAKVIQALKEVNLIHAVDMKFHDLSLGMKQRLGIARALMGNDQILLLDEPQNGLDPLGIKAVRELLNTPAIRKDKVTLLASHNLNEISRIVDKIVFVNHGEIIGQIDNQTDSIYYVYSHTGKITVPVNQQWQISRIKSSNYILTTLNEDQLTDLIQQFDWQFIGDITSLENLFDFVIIGEVDGNVNADE